VQYTLRQQRAQVVASSTRTWRQPVATSSDLPDVGNTDGDARAVIDSGTVYVWDGTEWVSGGGAAGVTSVDGLTGAVSLSGTYAPIAHVGASPGASPEPHPGYATDAELAAVSAVADAATTVGEAATIAATGIASHVGQADPHEGYLLRSIISAKGSILTRDSSAATQLPVGTDGYVLTARASETPGLAWVDPPRAAFLRTGSGAWHPVRVGDWACSAQSGVSITNYVGKMSAWQGIFDRRQTVNGLALLVSTLNAGSVGRVALYRDNGSCYPGALVIESGEISGATQGFKATTGLSGAFECGEPYWGVLWWGATSCTLRGTAAANHPCVLGHDGTTSVDPPQGWEYTAAYTSGANSFTVDHPTFPAGAVVFSGRTGVPNIFQQLA
jgi:hypothetical protein